MASIALKLGPTTGVHRPDYQLQFFANGNPAKPRRGFDLRSVIAIQTSKNMNDLAGTFTITLKDRRARAHLRAMDAGIIRLRGHYSPGLVTVLKVVVDNVRPGGTADAYASQQDTVITGRCVGKYLQATSLFLPVWDPGSLLPTALTFGYGDATKKVGSNRPYDINRYLIRRFTYGVGAAVGLSAIPNSRHWVDYHSRFSRKLGFQVPFLQFDENSVAEAFQRLEVTGFTEAWLDELGRQVYRRPHWDQAVNYSLNTTELREHALDNTDVEVTTYVEVIPAGDPGIDSATAQALRAGRAPVPSSYTAGADTSLSASVSREFIIDTDRKGQPTKKGKANKWYRLQRRFGLRPQQITSPLIFSQAQAQAQAEGLLRFYSRMTKSIQATIPGCPELRLGRNIRVHGDLDGARLDRVFYIEQVSHDYVDGQGFSTSFTGTHGRDPSDPKWGKLVLPRFQPADIASGDGGGGTMDSSGGGRGGAVEKAAKAISGQGYPYVWGGGHAHAGTPDGGTGRDPGIGYDCSGSVVAALAIVGGFGFKLGDSVPGSGTLAASWGRAGVGKVFTVWANANHVFMQGDGWRFDTGGPGGGKGPRYHTETRDTTGFTARHWPGH